MEDWFKKQWAKYQPEIIGGILLTIILAIVTGIWALAQTWAGPLIIPLVLGVIAFGLLITNQVHIIRERNKKSFANQSAEIIETTIRDWLDDPFFKFQRKGAPTYLFQFVVTDEAGRPITIARPKSKPTQLELATAITLGETHRQKYETLSSFEKEKVLHTLRIEMARYGIGYSGIHGKLERVVLSDIVLLDNSLTEFYLKRHIFYVTGAFALYKEVIGMALSERGSYKEGSQTE